MRDSCCRNHIDRAYANEAENAVFAKFISSNECEWLFNVLYGTIFDFLCASNWIYINQQHYDLNLFMLSEFHTIDINYEPFGVSSLSISALVYCYHVELFQQLESFSGGAFFISYLNANWSQRCLQHFIMYTKMAVYAPLCHFADIGSTT